MSLPTARRPTSSSTEELPMAVTGQLQWVRRPHSSLSVLATEIGDGGEDPPCLWWPSVLFNEYNDFQDFFQDEIQPCPNDDETKEIIYSRIFQNMRQQRTVMVARLLGRPLREYVEIVEFAGEASDDDDDATVLPYQATEFVSFTRMPQEVHLPQMKPDAFMYEIPSETASEVSVVIDDDLYMSYMHALDLAATKRMSGPIAPHDTLRSDFRDIGRSELEKLSSSVKRLSENPTIVGNATKYKGPLKEQERSEGGKKDDSGKSDSDEETESGDEPKNAEKLSETQVEESTDTANLNTEKMDGIKLSFSESESLACENGLEASALPKADAESTSPADSSPVDAVNGGQPESKKPNDTNDSGVQQDNASDDNADTNGGIHSSSATVVSHSSDGPEATEVGTASLGTSPATTASINSPPPAEKQNYESGEKIESPEETRKEVETEAPKRSKRGRPRKSVTNLEENAKSNETLSPTKRSKRGRKPKEIVDLPESAKPSSSAPLSPTKKSKRGRKPKEIVDLPESAKPSSPAPLSPTKKSKRSRKPKAILSEPTDKKAATPAKTPRKQIRRGRPKKKADTPETPNKDDKSDAAVETTEVPLPSATPNDLLFTPPPKIERRLQGASEAVDSPEKTKGQGNHAHTIAASPGCEEPDIRPEDSFEEVCLKLEEAGWNIDSHDTYLSPEIGYDDMKSHPEWRNKKFFLGKESFVAFLRQTYSWVGKKTPKSRGRKRSNTVTPTYSSRSKRSRRSPPLNSPIKKESPSKFKFKSTEEEEFYFFGNLIKGLQRKCDWKYLKAKFHDWVYLLPGGKKESQGGKHLQDYFITEEEVVLYCMNNNYYERRHELGLVGNSDA